MFYDPIKRDHGLPHNPLNACVGPRPIGWISTVSKDGIPNLAPFSFFNLVAGDPPVVMFSGSPKPDNGRKDSQINAEQTGEFVFNLSTLDTVDQMNITASIEISNFDEMRAAGLTPVESRLVKAPGVAESPIRLECKYLQTIDMPRAASGNYSSVVLGQVVGIHIDDEYIVDGMVQTTRMRPLGRLGYNDYVAVENTFSLPRLTRQQLEERGILTAEHA